MAAFVGAGCYIGEGAENGPLVFALAMPSLGRGGAAFDALVFFTIFWNIPVDPSPIPVEPPCGPKRDVF